MSTGNFPLSHTSWAAVWLLRVGRLRAQLLDGLEIVGEHVWMLVIFGRDVLLDGLGEVDRVRPAKRQKEDVAVHRVS
jgi:hypothetical protein